MRIVKITGGLGNQMFQYAFAMALEERTGEVVYVDRTGYAQYYLHNGYELDRVFGIKVNDAPAQDIARLCTQPDTILKRIRRKYFTKKTHYIDRFFGYDEKVFTLLGDRYYDGYWQSEKYFSSLASNIRDAFRFKHELDRENHDLLDSIEGTSISIHVRRGDYLKSENLNVCGEAYYRNAIARSLEETEANTLVFFSDDALWCREQLAIDNVHCIFVDRNHGENAWQDMAMMSRCDHHIIANSSFSWWGAWLDTKPEARVWAPDIWNMRQLQRKDHFYAFRFDDILASGWETVPTRRQPK